MHILRGRGREDSQEAPEVLVTLRILIQTAAPCAFALKSPPGIRFVQFTEVKFAKKYINQTFKKKPL